MAAVSGRLVGFSDVDRMPEPAKRPDEATSPSMAFVSARSPIHVTYGRER